MIVDSIWFVALAFPVLVLSVCVWCVAFVLFVMSLSALRRAWSRRFRKDSDSE